MPWLDFQARRPAKREIADWFRRWPDANVGIVTGQVSNLVVLDIDPRHGGDASLADLAQRHGKLPPTLTARTGGGGRHLYFAAPADPIPLPSRVGLAQGIDVRAEGGMVVAPPSIHPSGEVYAWIDSDDEATEPVPMPRWLIGLIRGTAHRAGHGIPYWRRLAAEGVTEGERNSAIASFAGHLMWCGVDIEVIKELLLCWNRVRAQPPLDDGEVIRTIDSIRRTHARHQNVKGGPV